MNILEVFSCSGGMSRLLLDTKGGGVVARAEIFRWLGEPVEMAPHTCTCRTCGRTFR